MLLFPKQILFFEALILDYLKNAQSKKQSLMCNLNILGGFRNGKRREYF